MATAFPGGLGRVSTQWVASNVRAKALLSRRLGAGRARGIAAMSSLAEAQQALADGPYGRHVVAGQAAVQTEHAIASTLLWHLRVLAGWQPREGAQAMRTLAAGFEAANICAHARQLTGAPPQPIYELGALATAWPLLAETSSLAQLRVALSRTLWGDPDTESPADIALAVHASWAVRVARTVPQASSWAGAGLVLLIARWRLLERRELSERAAVHARRVLGTAAMTSTDLDSFAAAVPARFGWVLAGCNAADQLWRGEALLCRRLEENGFALLTGPGFGQARIIGAVAVLAADAWRCRAALQAATRGGGPMDVYDAVA